MTSHFNYFLIHFGLPFDCYSFWSNIFAAANDDDDDDDDADKGFGMILSDLLYTLPNQRSNCPETAKRYTREEMKKVKAFAPSPPTKSIATIIIVHCHHLEVNLFTNCQTA